MDQKITKRGYLEELFPRTNILQNLDIFKDFFMDQDDTNREIFTDFLKTVKSQNLEVIFPRNNRPQKADF